MSLQRVPLMVNGGTGEGQQVLHSAGVMRQGMFSALGGQTGIIGPGSLEVAAGATPGPFVTVGPGAGTITYAQGQGNRQDRAYASAPDQLVPVRCDSLTQVDIEPTSSAGGRTDLVCIEINDPEFEGTSGTVDYATHEFVRFRVIQGVSTTTRYPWQLSSLPRPVLPLARVHIPASTATITNDMIQDVRRVSKPNSEAVKMLSPANPSGGNIEIGPEETDWVTIATFTDIEVPAWATYSKISMTLTHAYAVGGKVGGVFRVLSTGQNASVPTQASNFIEDSSGSNRFSLHCAGEIRLHRTTPGATATMAVQIRRTGDPADRPGTLRIPDFSSHTAMLDGWRVWEEGPRYSVNGA
ncbi:hypothetical protein [Nesterenkonia suensis]